MLIRKRVVSEYENHIGEWFLQCEWAGWFSQFWAVLDGFVGFAVFSGFAVYAVEKKGKVYKPQKKRKERYINHKSSMSHIIYFQIRIFKPILWYAVYYNCNTNNKTYCYYCCCYSCCYSCYFCWCYCCARRRRNHGVVSRVQATARAKAQVWATAKP